MESRFNIPAPAVVKFGSDVLAEMGRRLKVAVCPQGQGRGGFGQSGSIKLGRCSISGRGNSSMKYHYS
jgi:hypothetical protein